jgi:CYTH domain-containing protein
MGNYSAQSFPALEIEAKLLIFENGQSFLDPAALRLLGTVDEIREGVRRNGSLIEQGYFADGDFPPVWAGLDLPEPFPAKEIRLRTVNGYPVLTAKGEGGLVRKEYEIPVSTAYFERFWPLTEGRRVRKRRWTTQTALGLLEIDDYADRDLLVAELNFPDEASYTRMQKIGKDVTNDPKFKNRNLAR